MDDREVLAELRKLSQLVAEFAEPGGGNDEETAHVLRSAETRRLLDAFGSWITTLPRSAKPCADISHQGDTYWTYDHKICLKDEGHVFCRKHHHLRCPICGGALR